ncbi:hypothetical protein WA026_017549 [Henosepilachna vigintioctopunctata]|uniref:Uncharacterized protein n=1 Tax=Henosepilachna vigintioctopunctata TaxID=420089 RepID=A0AAW1V0G1_9CUCU
MENISQKEYSYLEEWYQRGERKKYEQYCKDLRKYVLIKNYNKELRRTATSVEGAKPVAFLDEIIKYMYCQEKLNSNIAEHSPKYMDTDMEMDIEENINANSLVTTKEETEEGCSNVEMTEDQSFFDAIDDILNSMKKQDNSNTTANVPIASNSNHQEDGEMRYLEYFNTLHEETKQRYADAQIQVDFVLFDEIMEYIEEQNNSSTQLPPIAEAFPSYNMR